MKANLGIKKPDIFSVVCLALILGLLAPQFAWAISSVEPETSNTSAPVRPDGNASNGKYIEFIDNPDNSNLSGCSNIQITPQADNVFAVTADVSFGDKQNLDYFASHYFVADDPSVSVIAKRLNSSSDITANPLRIGLNPNEVRNGINKLSIYAINSVTGDEIHCNLDFVFGASGNNIAHLLNYSLYSDLKNTTSKQKVRVVINSKTTTLKEASIVAELGSPISYRSLADATISNGVSIDKSMEISYGDSEQNRNSFTTINIRTNELGKSYGFMNAMLNGSAVSWNPPSTVDLIDPRPFLQRISMGASMADNLKVLNEYSQYRYDQSVAKGFNPIVATKHRISTAADSLSYEPVLLNPELASHKESLAITVHSLISSWSRIPLKISSAIRVDRQDFVHSMPVAAAYATCGLNANNYCSGDYHTIHAVRGLSYEDSNQTFVSYSYFEDVAIHELGHIFDFYHLQTVLKEATMGSTDGFRYKPFTDARPPGFTKYGDASLAKVSGKGHVVGFDSSYGTKTQYEDIAETFVPFFGNTEWSQVKDIVNAPFEDPYYGAKNADILRQLQRIEPRFTEDVIKQINALPSFKPLP